MGRYRHAPLPLSIEGEALLREIDIRFRRVSATVAGIDDIASLRDFMDHFNGSFMETFDALCTSDGATVTASLEQSGGGDLTMRFSDGLEVLDCTPAQTIALTPGSDVAPQPNYLFIPLSTKVLTKSTSFWPADAEHIKVAYILAPSAAFVQSHGCYVNQNWNDHAEGTDGQGHMLHMTARIRTGGALYFSGLDPNGATSYITASAGVTELKITAGLVAQLHLHTTPAVDTSVSSSVMVKNWSGDAYHEIHDLFDITADSTGTAIGANKYFNLVVWGAANKSGEFEPTMINLPAGSYNTLAGALQDTSGYDDFKIPREFSIDSSTGYLICRLTIQMGGTWNWESTTDLRGQTPQTAAGGAAAGAVVSSFPDNQFFVYDESDVTKKVALECSGIATATTRTLTVPDNSGTIALTSDTPSLALSALTDVTITGIASGELLKWDGAAWINQTLAELNLGDITAAVVVTGGWRFNNDIIIGASATLDLKIHEPTGGEWTIEALSTNKLVLKAQSGSKLEIDDGSTLNAMVAGFHASTSAPVAEDYPDGTIWCVYTA